MVTALSGRTGGCGNLYVGRGGRIYHKVAAGVHAERGLCLSRTPVCEEGPPRAALWLPCDLRPSCRWLWEELITLGIIPFPLCL